MMTPSEPIVSPPEPSFAPKLYGSLFLIVATVIVGIVLVARFATSDIERDMQIWQEKLNLIAESRAADVNNWVSERFKSLRTLAGNPSLQLYMSELQTTKNADKSSSDVAPAQKSYLRNLLLFTAEQSGFSATSAIESMNANVQQEHKSGLAILNNNNQAIVSTVMNPAMMNLLLAHAATQIDGKETLIDLKKDNDGTAYIGFIVPVFPIQSDRSTETQIGKVVGIRTVSDSLFTLLKHPGITEQTLEIILVRMVSGGKIDYLSPLKDGTGAMEKQLDFSPHGLAEAELIRNVGDFVNDTPDYRGKPTLATSRAIAGTPWQLIVKIDRQEALAKSAERRVGMTVIFVLIIAVVALLLATLWWYAHSNQATMMSRHFRKLAAQTMAQEHLLRLVTDHQPEPVFILDTQLHYHFANHRAALEAGMSMEFILGKSLKDVRGTGRASYIQEQCEKATKQRRIIYDMARVEVDRGDRIVRSAFVPLDHIPVAALPEATPGILIVEQDISDVVHERERRLETQNHLIQTLVRLVDKRDPFSANHSLLVSQVAHRIASDMELHANIIDTARIAGCLMNIGKIVIPVELLTKNVRLTDEEKKTIHEFMMGAADLLKGIDFDGPVAETLRQWQEKWDGTGPLGLRGEAILITARIIAVANAFIGMISPRSWRTAIPIETATKFLLDHSDTHFDHRVVIALTNYIENHNGRAWVEQILAEQRNAA